MIPVVTARDMFEAVTSVSEEQDIIIKAAAVADYRPLHVADEKVKKQDGEMSIELERTDDILKYLGEHRRPGQFLCGFSMETENMIGNSRAKAGKEKSGYGGCQQCKNGRRRIPGGYQYPDPDYTE